MSEPGLSSVRVAPSGSRLATRLIVAAALSLAIAVGLGLWAWRLIPRREQPPPEPVAAAPALSEAPIVKPPNPEPASIEPRPTPSVKPLSEPVKAPDPPVKPPAPAHPPPEPPTVARIEPAEPRAGEKVILRFADTGTEVRGKKQYRVVPDREWKPVQASTLELSNLKPGAVTIELRTLADDGRASPSTVRAVTVLPLAPPPIKAVPELGWNKGTTAFQEVVVRRVSRYNVLGADLGQGTQYAFLSQFTVDEKDADGTLKVRQKVVGARLDNADLEMQDRLDDLLKKTRGATFTFTVSPRGEVGNFDGSREALKVFTGTNPLGGPSFLLWSFMDKDGWRELAEASFFQPRQPVRKGDRWARAMTHSWGPLGRWDGQIGYGHLGKQGGIERYDYALEMAYKPPADGGAGLPFKIGRAEFRVLTAAGSIGIDPGNRRVKLAEERFHVRGQLTVSALGVDAPVETDEMQVFQLRLHDRNPWEK